MKSTDETLANPTTAHGEREENAALRVVRRYPNRRLYDTQTRSYVSLEAVAQWIQAGEVVSVVDQRTGENITATTLQPLLLEGLGALLSKLSASEISAILRSVTAGSWPDLQRSKASPEPEAQTTAPTVTDSLEARVAKLEHEVAEMKKTERSEFRAVFFSAVSRR